MQSHIINPKTKRMIGVKTKTAIRLAKTGLLNEKETELVLNANKTEPETQEPAQSPCSRREPDFKQESEPVVIQPGTSETSERTNHNKANERANQNPDKSKKKIKKELKEIAQENKEQFVGISQEQSDELLKKMLYEKLFVNKPTSDKKKKKKKKRVIVQSSSDDSDSDSESDW
jgi:hypothetical protein